MISFIYSPETINDVVLINDYFWWSDADFPADNLNSNKTLLARGVSTLFINGEPAITNGLTKFKNPPPWHIILLVVPSSKIPLFYEDLISFITSSFVRVVAEPLLDVIF